MSVLKQSGMIIVIGLGTGFAVKAAKRMLEVNHIKEARKIIEKVEGDDDLKEKAIIVSFVMDNFKEVNNKTGGDYSENVVMMSKMLREELEKEA